MLQPGALLAGKYRVLRLIGRGGMAEVYAATHEVLQQTVAIKILLPDVAASAGATARFINEARAAARIRGENVAAVTDVSSLEDGSAYMVLEYLEGEDLEDYATRTGPLAPEQAVDFVLQALQALAQAHTLGFVHRDIKPSNLYLTRRHDGSSLVKVLDFGISKAPRLSESSEGHATSTRTVLGSPYYMSPEQARSARSVDPRTDQWAIGVTLYRLLTGELPFGGETLTELLLEIVEATPLRPRSYRPELPEALEAVVMRCLRKDREERFGNVAELAQALLPFADIERSAVERICRMMGITRSAVPAVTAAAPVAAPAAAPVPAPLAELAAYEHTAPHVAFVPAGTVSGKPPSSGGATSPTIPAPPMPGSSPPLVGTVASAGVGTHASWAESSKDVPLPPRRSPLLLILGAGGFVVIGGIVFALTAGHGSSARSAAPANASESTAAPTRPPETTAVTAPSAAAAATLAPEPPPPAAPAATTAPGPSSVSLSPPPPLHGAPTPALRSPVPRAAGGKTSTPSPSARPGAGAPPAPATPPAQDAYDVLNQRN